MYKLSNLAAEDFGDIYEYTLLTFGVAQADLYTDNIESCLQNLSAHPMMGRDLSDVVNGVRRHDHGQHAIFYRIMKYHIFIMRILHQQMDPIFHLEE